MLIPLCMAYANKMTLFSFKIHVVCVYALLTTAIKFSIPNFLFNCLAVSHVKVLPCDCVKYLSGIEILCYGDDDEMDVENYSMCSKEIFPSEPEMAVVCFFFFEWRGGVQENYFMDLSIVSLLFPICKTLRNLL